VSAALRAPGAAALLEVWEHARGRSPGERAQALLVLACPEADPATLAELSVGRRDARLLAFRERTFGSQLAGLTRCPGCGERLELDIGAGDLAVAGAAEPSGRSEPTTPATFTQPAPCGEVPEWPVLADPLTLSNAGFEVRFRLPTAGDLAAATASDIDAARLELLARCVVSIHEGSRERPVTALPPSVVDELARAMARADPQADMHLALTCPSCHHSWEALFDIADFLWREVEAWAARLLRDVHALASAYGWRETDILSMSPWRREAYLELIRS
jgi:hypothetical protein